MNKIKKIFMQLIELFIISSFIFLFFYPHYNIADKIESPSQFVQSLAYPFLNLIIIIVFSIIILVKIFTLLNSFKTRSFISVLLGLISSGIMCVVFSFYTIEYADSIEFFVNADKKIYFVTFYSFSLFSFYLYKLANVIFTNDPSYKDYKHIKINQNIDEIDEKEKNIRFFISIRQKIIVSFITAMLLIEVLLSYMILADYKKTILEAVTYTAITLTEQSTLFFKENFTDSINLEMYLKNEVKRNKDSKFQYNKLTFFMKQPKVDVYQSILDSENILSKEDIEEFSKIDKAHSLHKDNIYYFVSPVIISSINIGYTVIEYSENVIYKPFFKALVRVIFLTIVVMYISLFFIIYFGNHIVFPILYLQVNVKIISTILLKMISGKSKKSADLLQYIDKVRSRDEIKSLSIAVDEMVTIIRGIIPYISSSTLANSDKQGEKSIKTDMAFLFTDIRGFTTLCEGMPPDEVVDVLNRYLNLQADMILANHGDIDKFVGDEIMASFDGPDKELNACKAAWAIINQMEEERKNSEHKGFHIVTIGIGINSGSVVFGNVGAKDRMDFTSIGDTVNLAARLEGTNKEYKTSSLISEFVYEKVKDHFLCREIDLVAVKGKSNSVRIYEILGELNKVDESVMHLKKLFEAGLQAYRQKKWDKAINKFEEAVDLFKDATSDMFLQRIDHFIANPPEDKWDGVFVMKVK